MSFQEVFLGFSKPAHRGQTGSEFDQRIADISMAGRQGCPPHGQRFTNYGFGRCEAALLHVYGGEPQHTG